VGIALWGQAKHDRAENYLQGLRKLLQSQTQQVNYPLFGYFTDLSKFFTGYDPVWLQLFHLQHLSIIWDYLTMSAAPMQFHIWKKWGQPSVAGHGPLIPHKITTVVNSSLPEVSLPSRTASRYCNSNGRINASGHWLLWTMWNSSIYGGKTIAWGWDSTGRVDVLGQVSDEHVLQYVEAW